MDKETEREGRWHCKNCGDLFPREVTFIETCSTCHMPVYWIEEPPPAPVVGPDNTALVGALKSLKLFHDGLKDKTMPSGELWRLYDLQFKRFFVDEDGGAS